MSLCSVVSGLLKFPGAVGTSDPRVEEKWGREESAKSYPGAIEQGSRYHGRPRAQRGSDRVDSGKNPARTGGALSRLNQREEQSERRPPWDPLGAHAYALCFRKVIGGDTAPPPPPPPRVERLGEAAIGPVMDGALEELNLDVAAGGAEQ
ncbi:unnamed protein product [Arctogadus glacialis]